MKYLKLYEAYTQNYTTFAQIFNKDVPSVEEVNTNELSNAAYATGMDLDSYIDSLPIETVDMDKVVPTQHRINWNKINDKIHTQPRDENDIPFAIFKNGWYYLFDGHHRATKAKLDGLKEIKMKVFHSN